MSENEILDETFVCEICSLETNDENELMFSDEDGQICENCYDDTHFGCESCNEFAQNSDRHYVEGSTICSNCWENDTSSCYGCDEQFFQDNMCYSDNNEAFYCDDCYEDSDPSDRYEWNVYSNTYVKENTDFVHPNRHKYHMVNGVCVAIDIPEDGERLDSFDLIPSKRSQGLEIEFNETYDYRRSDVVRALHTDIVKKQRSNPDDVPSSVRVDADGSTTDEDNPYGHEIVMSPRRGDIIANDLITVCDTIKGQFGGYVSHRCGYHLHIDSRDFDWYHMLMLVGMTKLIEPHIYAFLPSSRRTSHWCKPVSQSWSSMHYIDGRDRFMEWYYDYTSYTNYKYNDKRYHGLNLHSHFQANQGVELRYHSGTLNPTKMMHWSIFWSQLMDKCYDLATDAYNNAVKSNTTSSAVGFTRPRKWMQDNVFKSITDPVSHIEYSHYGFSNQKDYADYLRDNYHYNIDEIDYGKYYNDSRKICDMLGITNPSEGCYSILQLASMSNVNIGMPTSNNPVMTKNAMFRLFDIPVETQLFYNDMLLRRIKSPDTPSNHIDNCFRNVDRFVDYDEKLGKFINVDYVVGRLKTVSDETARSAFNDFSRSEEVGRNNFSYQQLDNGLIVD